MSILRWMAPAITGAALLAGMAAARGGELEVQALPAPAQGPVDFDSHIRPIFEAHCLNCHVRGKAKGGLSLETRESLLRGGEGGPAVEVGKSGESLLIELVTEADPALRMPQKGAALSAAEVGRL